MTRRMRERKIVVQTVMVKGKTSFWKNRSRCDRKLKEGKEKTERTSRVFYCRDYD